MTENFLPLQTGEKPNTLPRELIDEYTRFTSQIGGELLVLLEDISDNARRASRLFANCKNPIETALTFMIRETCFEDFKKAWPYLSNSEIITHALEAALIVYRHLEQIRLYDKNYQSGMVRRKERNKAVAAKEISKNFPVNFTPPPQRGSVKPDSLPNEEWLKRLTKRRSRLSILREEDRKVWEKIDAREAKKNGCVPKGATLLFNFDKNQ